MEIKIPKCSLKTHIENNAVLYCYECKIYICSKCEKLHSGLFPNHHQLKIDNEKDISNIFTGLCNEKGHNYELKYFCKTHNKLCCAECITKFKGKLHGQHTDCNVCSIEDIEKEKKEKLNENIKCLENISVNFEESIKELKTIYEKIEKSKEEIKIDIQKVFTKIRNVINDREEELILDVDNKFKELLYNEDIIKENEKLPNKIKIYLEKGKLINNNWKDNLNSLINDCLNIENIINEINRIKGMKKINLDKNKIRFIITEDDLNKLFEKIKTFGSVDEIPPSQILKSEDFVKIKKWIGGCNAFIPRYSTKIDGCNMEIFHEKCDNISGLILVCKVEGRDIIGAYITAKIQKKDEYSDDNKAFLFNLTKNIIKKNKKSYKNAFKNFSDSSCFIKFGNSCQILKISGNCLNDQKSYITTCTCETNFDCDQSNIFNENKSESFKIENFEVFQVI